MSSRCAARRAFFAARFLILLYLWAFPFLGAIHQEAAHHGQQPACAGFAQEHNRPSADGWPLVSNLHVQEGEEHCAVCALARSAATASPTSTGALPAMPSVAGSVSGAGSLLPRSSSGSLGSRAPPVA